MLSASDNQIHALYNSTQLQPYFLGDRSVRIDGPGRLPGPNCVSGRGRRRKKDTGHGVWASQTALGDSSGGVELFGRNDSMDEDLERARDYGEDGEMGAGAVTADGILEPEGGEEDEVEYEETDEDEEEFADADEDELDDLDDDSEEEHALYTIQGGSSDGSDEHEGAGVYVTLTASLLVDTSLQQYPLLSSYRPPALTGDLAAELTAATALHDPTAICTGPRSLTGELIGSPVSVLRQREAGLGGHGLSTSEQAHLLAHHRLPTHPSDSVDQMDSRGYIGRYAPDGSVFIAGYQDDGILKVYDASDFSVLKEVEARQLHWTITDIALSPSGRHLLYSSINSTVHMVDIAAAGALSIGNVTEMHEALELTGARGDVDDYHTGVWSLQWSPVADEIIAGTADNCLYIYNLAQGRSLVRLPAHDDHVNAVEYLDDSGNLILTGSDDRYVKVWDRRTLRGGRRRDRPVGVFIGHTEGLTHLDAKGDGRYLLSNSKDQTIKVWDMRAVSEPSAIDAAEQAYVPSFRWDYRWMDYPARKRVLWHPMNGALSTLRGHRVLSTLVRAYWSPVASTGQRYIYAGSADGVIRIWDVLSNTIVATLKYNRSHRDPTVRECSWHPYLPLLTSVDFNGRMVNYEPEQT